MLARFVPVVRTVLNPVAGALGVPIRAFALWQVVGGAVWTVGLVLAGFLLGGSVPGIDQYLLPVIALIVVVSLLPLAVELIRSRGLRTAEDPPTHVPPRTQAPTERPRSARTRKRSAPGVMVLDHDSARRTRMAALLEHAADFDLVGTTSTAAITRALLETLGPARPDVVLVALDLSDGEGSGAVASVRAGHPGVQVMCYADDPLHPFATQVLVAGATAVLTERTLLDDLRTALRVASTASGRRA